jgi:hypothetical protein
MGVTTKKYLVLFNFCPKLAIFGTKWKTNIYGF